MILDANSGEKPEIEYPCEWGYKIIGTDKVKLELCIFEVMAEKAYTTKAGNTSSRGTFHTLNARCVVISKEERDRIFKAFKEHGDVKMVI